MEYNTENEGIAPTCDFEDSHNAKLKRNQMQKSVKCTIPFTSSPHFAQFCYTDFSYHSLIKIYNTNPPNKMVQVSLTILAMSKCIKYKLHR